MARISARSKKPILKVLEAASQELLTASSDPASKLGSERVLSAACGITLSNSVSNRKESCQKDPCHNEHGASLVEYALLVSLVALVCYVAVTNVGTKLNTKYSKVASGCG